MKIVHYIDLSHSGVLCYKMTGKWAALSGERPFLTLLMTHVKEDVTCQECLEWLHA